MVRNTSGNHHDKDPWTGKPKRNSLPDFEQAIRNLRKKLNEFKRKHLSPLLKGSNQKPSVKLSHIHIGLLFLGVLGLWVVSGMVRVKPDEQAVITRFGKYIGTVEPGLHWILPFIDKIYSINKQKIVNYNYTAQMLTQDQNLMGVNITVQYRIKEAKAYLFNVVNPIETLKQASVSALYQIMGHTTLDKLLTSSLEPIRQELQDLLTNLLEPYHTGLDIIHVTLLPTKIPDEVKDAFDDVTRAQADEQAFINQAKSYTVQVKFDANTQAKHLLLDAKSYQFQAMVSAKADTAQFLALLADYRKNPEMISTQMYLDMFENVLSHTNKLVIASAHNPIYYLSLDQLSQNISQSTAINSMLTPLPVKNATKHSNIAAASGQPN